MSEHVPLIRLHNEIRRIIHDFKPCIYDDCGGWLCRFHGLESDVRDYMVYLKSKADMFDQIVAIIEEDDFDEELMRQILALLEGKDGGVR